MSASAVTARLREVARLASEKRRRPVDMSPAAVTGRLRKVSELRELCLKLGRLRPLGEERS